MSQKDLNFSPQKAKQKKKLQLEANRLLLDALRSLMNSEETADVNFVIQHEPPIKVPAHKTILIARSPIFAAMFSRDMKEFATNEIEIPDMEEPALEIVLNYIYTGELAFVKGIEVDENVCKQIVDAANKYELPELKEYAAMVLTEFISEENALHLLKFVTLHKAQAAIVALESYAQRNFKAVFQKNFDNINV